MGIWNKKLPSFKSAPKIGQKTILKIYLILSVFIGVLFVSILLEPTHKIFDVLTGLILFGIILLLIAICVNIIYNFLIRKKPFIPLGFANDVQQENSLRNFFLAKPIQYLYIFVFGILLVALLIIGYVFFTEFLEFLKSP